MLYSKTFITEDGRILKKIYVNYVSDEKGRCDCCDEEKPYVSLTFLCGDSSRICKDCLSGIVKLF